MKPTKTASNTNNVFTVTLDGAAASGQTVNFALLSLFPPTFKNRPNGMRIDIAEVSTAYLVLQIGHSEELTAESATV